MKLYLTPGACSLASHIALREAAVPFDFLKVDLGSKLVEDGSSFGVRGRMSWKPCRPKG